MRDIAKKGMEASGLDSPEGRKDVAKHVVRTGLSAGLLALVDRIGSNATERTRDSSFPYALAATALSGAIREAGSLAAERIGSDGQLIIIDDEPAVELAEPADQLPGLGSLVAPD